MDIVQGVSIPLPDVWHIEVDKQTNGDPNFKITKQNVAPHSQAIKLGSEVSLGDDTSAALWLVSR